MKWIPYWLCVRIHLLFAIHLMPLNLVNYSFSYTFFLAYIVTNSNIFKHKSIIIILLHMCTDTFLCKVLAWVLSSKGSCQLEIFMEFTKAHWRHPDWKPWSLCQRWTRCNTRRMFFHVHTNTVFRFLLLPTHGNVPFYVNVFCPLSWAFLFILALYSTPY